MLSDKEKKLKFLNYFRYTILISIVALMFVGFGIGGATTEYEEAGLDSKTDTVDWSEYNSYSKSDVSTQLKNLTISHLDEDQLDSLIQQLESDIGNISNSKNETKYGDAVLRDMLDEEKERKEHKLAMLYFAQAVAEGNYSLSTSSSMEASK